jgi:5-methyltetrahydropteroyltriglutamate--homocysteine methyltransferase
VTAHRYYPSTEDYILALAEAMKPEYDAIHEAGLVLQLDCPDLACDWARGERRTLADFRKTVGQRLAALDYATRDIPGEAMRLHLCWGNYEGPHHTDIPLADIIDLVLQARPMALSFEGANPRHEHEWQVFEDVKQPDGKILVPGVLDSTTNYMEHPELVAQRIGRYAGLVGRENVMAGTDCGFATFASFITVEPEITWAKLAAMAEGARLASAQLGKRTVTHSRRDDQRVRAASTVPRYRVGIRSSVVCWSAVLDTRYAAASGRDVTTSLSVSP